MGEIGTFDIESAENPRLGRPAPSQTPPPMSFVFNGLENDRPELTDSNDYGYLVCFVGVAAECRPKLGLILLQILGSLGYLGCMLLILMGLLV